MTYPSCGELMNRSLHGKRSGVVVDGCRDHGLWLDAGELRQLME
jgi:Zn-finger nucleic acid-binding protein